MDVQPLNGKRSRFMITFKMPRENRELLIKEIQQYFQSEYSQTLGNLEVESLIDLIAKNILPHVYNQAITDARNVLIQQLERADEELSFLLKPIENRR
jgi:uncharacterized protein (DUF2164 family)